MLKPGFQCVEEKEIHLKRIKDIVLMGDIACTPFNETSKKVLSEILKINTDLFIVLGDLSFLGTEKELNDVADFCNPKVTVPIFTLCGNHDIKGFSQVFGMATYAIILDQFVICVLDNSHNHFSEDSFIFLEYILGKYREERFLITFHIPPPTNLDKRTLERSEWEKLKAVSDQHRDRIDAIFTGHIHGFQEYYLDSYRIFISGGGGAALYNLEKDTLKSYHAIKVSLKNNASLNINVIPIKPK